MIAKQIKGKNFRGVLEYLHEKRGSYVLGGNMAGDTPSIMSKEFAIASQLNPNLKKVVSHSSLSLPKSEHLDDATWRAIAADYLEKMGFRGCQYVVYRHSDRKHEHIHMVASRIRITDGTTVSDSWDYLRSERIVRELEQKYQLTPTISFRDKYERGQTTGEIKLIERTGEESVRLQLQKMILAETNAPSTMPILINRLKNKNIDVKVNINETEQIKGISYELNGIAFSGSHLGRGYTFAGLQQYNQVSYDPNSDHESLLAASNRKPVRKTKLELAQQQQQERSLAIAPILRNLVNQTRNNHPETKHYRISWQKDLKTLALYKKNNSENNDSLVLLVRYQDQKFEPLEIPLHEEIKPLIKQSDLDYWHQISIKLSQSAKLSQNNTKLKYAFKI